MRLLLRQSERFLGTIAWFFARTARQQPARFVALLAASGSGLAALSLGFGVVFAVLTALERGEPLAFGGASLDPSDRTVLALIAAGAGLVVMVGASLVFSARRLAVAAASELQRQMADDVLSARAPLLDDPRAYASERRLNAALIRLATGNARRCALALRRGLEVPVPLAVALVSFAVLFVLEPMAAGVSVVLGATILPVMYRVNLGGVRASKRYEALLGPSRQDVVRLFGRRAEGEAVSLEGPAGAPNLLALIDAFRDRVVAALRAEFTTQLLGAATTFGLLVYLAVGVLDDRIGLVAAGAFMVALRFVLGGARAVFVGIASISRYYPFLYAHRVFLRALRPPTGPAAPNPGAPAATGRLRAAAGALHEPGVPLPTRLEPSGVVWSLTPPLPLHAVAVGYVAWLLAGGDVEGARPIRTRLLAATGDADAAEPITVRSVDDLDDPAQPPSRAVKGAVLLWCKGQPPRGLDSALHLVGGPDGRVLAWGRVPWVRANWNAIGDLLRAATAAADGFEVQSEPEDDVDA